MACVLMLPLLAACETSSNSVKGTLPAPPSDIQLCFRQSGVVIPDRALTIYDVESLWKQDRIRIAVLNRCGNRLLSWYDDLRRNWQ